MKHLSSHHRLTLVMLLALTLSACDSAAGPGVFSAPAQSASECAQEASTKLQQQQRIYRSILTGQLPADQEALNAVRYTEDGAAWIKTAQNTWKTASIGRPVKTLSDAGMNTQTEWPGMNEGSNDTANRSWKGILETKGVLTSELVEPLAQSYRALTYRLAMVCNGIQASFASEETGPIAVPVEGGRTFQMESIASCRATQSSESAQDTAHCEQMANDILEREAAVLKFIVAYDASTRTLLQYSGVVDAALENFQTDLLTPLEQAMSILEQLSRIPCFVAQCNG